MKLVDGLALAITFAAIFLAYWFWRWFRIWLNWLGLYAVRKAAEMGEPYAQYYLGLCYYQGKGIKKDRQEAFRWLRKAADQGYEKAKNALAKMSVSAPDHGPLDPFATDNIKDKP